MQQDIDDFLLYLATERGLSENYQLSTRISLEGFAGWYARRQTAQRLGEAALESATQAGTPIPHDPIESKQVTLVQVGEYLAHRKRAGLASASIKLIAVALKIFFRWLHVRGKVPEDATEVLSLPRVERFLPETLNELQVERLLAGVPTEGPRVLRDKAMVELLYASGLRVSELVNARLENLDLDSKVIRVVGKGNKMRLVPVGTQACEALKAYIDRERPGFVGKKTGSEIFLSTRHTKLTPMRVRQILKEIAKLAGLDVNVYPHLLRHSFATHLLSNGADLRIIQEMLGHADISTTEVYTHVDQSRLKVVHHKFHPRA